MERNNTSALNQSSLTQSCPDMIVLQFPLFLPSTGLPSLNRKMFYQFAERKKNQIKLYTMKRPFSFLSIFL